MNSLRLVCLILLSVSTDLYSAISGPAKICLGDVSNFTYTPPSGLTVNSINWTFGDGGIASTLSPTHTYTAKGKFKIKVLVNFTNSTNGADSLDIEVFGVPKAAFYYLPSSDTCFNDHLVCYRDTSKPADSSQALYSRLIVWGDGTFNTYYNSLSGDTFCHRFPVPAKYNLYIEVTDKAGCKSRATAQKYVVENITADFTLKDSFFDCQTKQIMIRNKSFGAGPSTSHYRWYIDTSALDTAFHFNPRKIVYYNQSRSGKVTLIAYANNNCRDTMVKTFNFILDPLPNYLILSDTVLCNGDAAVVDCFPDITCQKDSICWYFDGAAPPAPVPQLWNWFWATQHKGIGPHEIKLNIFRGSCMYTLKKNIQLLGPYPSSINIENVQCFTKRKVFLMDKTAGINRANCKFYWTVADPDGENCIAWHSKGQNLYKNCNASRDHYFKHEFKNWDNLHTISYFVEDTITGCSDVTEIIVNERCSKILIPDTFHLCRYERFLDNATIPFPDSFSIDHGAHWLPFPSYLDSNLSGTFDIGFMFKKIVSPWAEDFGNDSIKVHLDTMTYYDTVFRGQKLMIHDNKTDSAYIKVYGKCRPFRVTMFFKKGDFDPGDQLRVIWNDHGNLDSTFVSPFHIDSTMHTYNMIGVNTEIQLYMQNKWGCKSLSRFTVAVGKNLSMYMPKFMNCIKDTICFLPFVYDFKKFDFWSQNTPNNKVSWYFPGDNASANTFNVCHKFNSGGMQPVEMRVSDSFGCRDTLRDTVFIQDPRANVRKMSKIVFCAELKQFFDSSSYFVNPKYHPFFPQYYKDSIKRYAWRFGDNVYNSFLKNPLQAINSSLDSIPAAHMIETVSGCTDTTYFTILVVGPKPYFFIRDTIGCGSLQAEFINKSRNTKHYQWNFGDSLGTVLHTSSSQNVFFNYTKPGRYYISLVGIDTVLNPITNKLQACLTSFPDKLFQKDSIRSVIVLPFLKTGIIGPDTFCKDVPVVFTSKSDSAYINDLWDMGDSTLYDTVSPSSVAHRYKKEGSFTIHLKALYKDPVKDKCRDSASKNVVVTGVDADFIVDPASLAPVFTFNNKSKPAPASILWDFGKPGPGNNSTDQNPKFNYGTDTGTYTICLVASIPFGCADTACKNIFNDYLSDFGIFNVFTPGLKDSLNDLYDIVIEGETKYELRIYNRWGDQVYYSDKDYDNNASGNWNGRVNNTGEECPAGTYYYIFVYELKSKPGESKSIHGVIKLIR